MIIHNVRPAADCGIHKSRWHNSLSVHQLVSLHDPTFQDMNEWLTLSAKDDGQHSLQHLAAQMGASDMPPNINSTQMMEVDAIEPTTTMLKQP